MVTGYISIVGLNITNGQYHLPKTRSCLTPEPEGIMDTEVEEDENVLAEISGE